MKRNSKENGGNEGDQDEPTPTVTTTATTTATITFDSPDMTEGRPTRIYTATEATTTATATTVKVVEQPSKKSRLLNQLASRAFDSPDMTEGRPTRIYTATEATTTATATTVKVVEQPSKKSRLLNQLASRAFDSPDMTEGRPTRKCNKLQLEAAATEATTTATSLGRQTKSVRIKEHGVKKKNHLNLNPSKENLPPRKLIINLNDSRRPKYLVVDRYCGLVNGFILRIKRQEIVHQLHRELKELLIC